MALIEVNHNPSQRDLTVFGLIWPVFFALIGGLIYWRGHPTVAQWVWIVAGVVWAVYVIVPPLRRWIYLGWIYLALPIGWTVSHVVLALAWYGVITPIALVMRAFGHDPLALKPDRAAATYWRRREPTTDPKRYFQQF